MPAADLVDEDYHPLPHSYVSFEGFLDAKLLVAILGKMGNTIGRDSLKKAAESIDDFDLGIDVKVSLSPRKHQGMDKVYFTTVEKDRFVRIDDWGRRRQ